MTNSEQGCTCRTLVDQSDGPVFCPVHPDGNYNPGRDSEQGAGELKTFWQEKIDGGAGLSWQEATYLLDYYITLCENVENVKKMNDTLDTVNSRLQAKVADLEKEREAMVTIEELGEKLRAVEIPLRSRIQALEAALNSYTICGDWCTCGYGWGHAVAREALRPDQGDVKRKCTCGESSPDRLVVHRTDGPCYLRPREGQSAQGGGKS